MSQKTIKITENLLDEFESLGVMIPQHAYGDIRKLLKRYVKNINETSHAENKVPKQFMRNDECWFYQIFTESTSGYSRALYISEDRLEKIIFQFTSGADLQKQINEIGTIEVIT